MLVGIGAQWVGIDVSCLKAEGISIVSYCFLAGGLIIIVPSQSIRGREGKSLNYFVVFVFLPTPEGTLARMHNTFCLHEHSTELFCSCLS